LDLEGLSNTLAGLFAAKGDTRAVAVLALAIPAFEHTERDNWNGGTDYYKLVLAIPRSLYSQIQEHREELQQSIMAMIEEIFGHQEGRVLSAVQITVQIKSVEDWRQKAVEWIAGTGVSNQGRVRSDNIASRECDGLLFRSVPEINVYKALKATGLPFAPLPVFLKGGRDYSRIEPDFIVLSEGTVLHVEVDGDTFHHETPAEAHERSTMLTHEGAFIERLKASECRTQEDATERVKKLLEALRKYKSSH
jgi:hypothetical protein